MAAKGMADRKMEDSFLLKVREEAAEITRDLIAPLHRTGNAANIQRLPAGSDRFHPTHEPLRITNAKPHACAIFHLFHLRQ